MFWTLIKRVPIPRYSLYIKNYSSISYLWNGNKPLMLSSCPVKTISLGFEKHSNTVAVNAREERMRKLNSI